MCSLQTSSPQIKICGLTIPEEAAACATAGADAIGLVFYPPSPRNISLNQAAAITTVLPAHVCPVGVFVDPTWAMLSEAIAHCGLRAVQLHGNEPQALIDQVQAHYGVKVIKGLFAVRAPRMEDAGLYSVSAFLVECGRGDQPGGNALSWNWAAAADFSRAHSMVLAGGLTPDNVAEAIAAARPDAVDASSGLESAPGRKDLGKVERFIAAVRKSRTFGEQVNIRTEPIFE